MNKPSLLKIILYRIWSICRSLKFPRSNSNMGWGGFPYTQHRMILRHRRQHQIAQVKGSVLQDCPHTHLRHQVQASGNTCASDPPATDWSFQWPPQVDPICWSSSQNSDKHLVSQFIKGYDEGYESTPRCKRCIGQNMEKGHEVSTPSLGMTPFSPWNSMCSPTRKLDLSFWGGRSKRCFLE